MSYADGIGGLPQPLSSIAPAATPSQQVSTTGIEETKGSEATLSQAAQTDHADLSTVGGLIGKALEVSDTRSAKVAALQQAIASGSYHVSSSDIADKLIDTLSD
jgi:negative regulator of flagellin synthesis FlgM